MRFPSDTAQHCKPVFLSHAVRSASLRSETLLISSRLETHINNVHRHALQIRSGKRVGPEVNVGKWHWFDDEADIFFIYLVASLNTANQASWYRDCVGSLVNLKCFEDNGPTYPRNHVSGRYLLQHWNKWRTGEVWNRLVDQLWMIVFDCVDKDFCCILWKK